MEKRGREKGREGDGEREGKERKEGRDRERANEPPFLKYTLSPLGHRSTLKSSL